MNRDSIGVFHVVKEHAQILPYCVIPLKSQALSTEFHKYVATPAPGPDVPTLPVTLQPQTKVVLVEEGIRADPNGSRTEDEEIKASLAAKPHPCGPEYQNEDQ